ncbi:MAG TPA: SpaA isopeptide-forming pilin-related protein [Eggerthellaceae bacterium]|nr:SpaA isopeptide-forming pilin-related protein [Eggerthellaceae bacterium]
MPGDTVLSNIELSAANSWFAEVDVPIGGLSYNNFKVVEVGLKDENDTFYPVVANSEEAESAYENIGIDKSWINTGWNYESTKDTSRVATPDHVYETTASKADEPNRNDSMRAVVAGNRRLGLIDLTVVKTWKDGAIHPDRPKATLEVVCTEYENAFSVDDQGNVWIQISHNKLPVMNAAGDDGENAQARQLNTARDPVAVENGRLLVTIKTDSDESQSTFHIYGLPKYDNDGIVVHYDINEVSADLGEYASNKDVSSYTVGPQHFHDSQTFTFENKRAATRDVTFYKQWNDRYVNDGLNQRPDIYLTLYRVTVTAGENNSLVYSAPETVTGYVHYLWHATGDTTDPQYAQSCTIEGLPAYDSDGNEYIYYASESMSADGSSLDYAPVKFDTTGIEGDDFVINGDGIKPEEKYVKIDSAAPSNDPAENGTGYAIHEGGTFVNDLTNNVVASGVKLWENVPGNVNQDDLPDLTVYLQQRVQGEDSWPALKFECDENGNWQFADGTSAVAWTSDLTRTTTNQYTYQLKFTGENTSEDLSAETPPEGQELLPRYDEDGNLYEYRAIEVIWGLVGQPGGITADDIEEIDFSQQRDFGDESQGIYVIGHGETGSFLLNNTYASEKGNLTVKKLFEGRDSGDLYPDITFDVYRYYVNDAGEKSSPSRVATHTISGEELNSTENSEDGNLVVKENNGNNSAEYTFTDLDIYAPDGSYWQYYVVEHAINGYTTTVNVGDIDSTDEVTGSGDQTSDGIRSNDLCKTNSATADDPAQVTNTVIKANDTTPDVTFKNSYKPDTISISGTKTWDDYSNLLGLRPTAEQFMEALTFKQIGNGSSEGTDLTDKLQKVDANAPFFYTILSSAENSDVFTITISNLEKWAPDGTAWHYQISENLDNMQIGTSGNHYADGYYQAVGGISQTVTANSSNASFSFRNKLKGSVTVHKDWENDGNDAYGLRPSSVTVRLQARITYESNMPDENGWEDACGLLQHNGYGEKLSQLLTALGQSEEQFFQRELNDGNGWNASWTGLPTAGIGKASGQGGNSFFTIEYRAVEIAIGDQEIESQPTEDATEENEGKIYGANTVSSYEPSQSDTGDAENGFHSTVTNTLDDTSITVTKTWSDGGDKWGIRPGTDTWSVTYLLQRKTGNDNDYSWVLEYSENDETVEITSPLNKRIVSQTISGGLSDNEKQVTWRNLPRTDDSGNAYEYRVIEQVPGGYDVTNGTPLTDSNGNPVTATDVNGVTWRYYVVEGDQDVGDGTDSQSFINALRTVDLQGTKVWEDFGTDIADSYTAADMPQMTLYRAIKNNDGTLEAGEQVKMKDGSDPAQPTWNKNSDGIWIFTYSDLPAADEQDRPYTYWAEEVDVTTDGFYPLYGTGEDQDASSHDASGTKIEKEATATESGQQTNETITNVATKLSLAKVSDFDTDPNTAGVQGEQLANIELSVMSVDGGTTYAVWTNGDGEKYKTYTWVNGTTTPEETENAICREDDNLIVGLPAGNYKVVETGEVPDGYAKASDVEFTINADGTVEAPSNATTTTEENIHTINVTAIDPVLRGHLQLTKRVSDDGAYDGANAAALVGAKFDLYRVDVDDDGKDERIASGLTTDSQGVITTVDNDAAISEKSSTGNFDLTYGGKYTKLSDGLPEGKYYFVETDATSGAVMPSAEAVKSDILEITQEEHYDYTNAPVEITMGNEKFNATVVLYKFDTVTSAGIGSAKFSLSYTPEGASTPSYTTDVTTDADGTLTLSGLEKGEYNLKETYNDGYDITNSFEATFIIDNDDDDKTFNIKNVSDGADIGFTVTSGEGTFIDGKGIPNTPLRGSVTMAKTGMDNVALNGATFELQRMNGTDWTTQEPTTIASGLVTGQTYQMNEDNTGVGAGTAGVDGQIQVNNLLWGTYRFIETDPAPGYVGVSSDGSNITSDDLVISRMNLNPSMMGNDAVRNTPTSLEINKQNDKGGALKDAQFEVTPIEGSKFADDTTNAKTITSGDDGHAILEGQLVVGGTYTIYETKGPLGYDPIDESLTIKVLENGDLEVEGDMPTGWKRADIDNDGQIDNQFSFMAINNPMTIEVEKVSSNDANIKLKGAKFSLTGVCMDNESTHTYMTDGQGKLKIDDGLIKGEHYTLTEVTTPAGYVSVGSLQFTMNERGEIVVENAEGTPAGWTVNDDKVSLVAADNPVKLQITKHAPASADGTPGKVLEGATFTITPVGESMFADGSKTARELETDENGIISSSAELVVGNQYDITETAAPEGYERVTGTMRIRVADDGTIQVVGSVENGQVTGNLAPSGYSRVGDNAFEVQVTNNPVEISIKKISSEDHATILPNATFELEGHFAGDTVGTSRVETVTSDENGTINISAQLVSGETYKLTETHAPEGYELNNVTLSFTVNENGTITVNGDMPDGYTVEQGNVTIVAADTPIVVDFLKKDLGDTTTLAGGEFRLSGTFVNDKTHETSQQEITFTVSENGFSFANMAHDGATYSLVAGNTYTIEETTAPDGYELTDPFSFMVSDNGTITVAEGFATAAEGQEGYTISDTNGTATLTAHDAPIEAKLIKVSGEKKLSGAVFELYEGSFATGTSVGNPMTTGDDGSVELEGLVAGKTYTLHEVTAPSGYELLSDVSFKVSSEGEISLVNEVAGYSVATDGGIATITANDTPIEAQLVKTNEEGAPLEGAVFTIEGTFAGDYAGQRTIELGATDESGIATVPAAVLIAGETYTLTEITAPQGYELAGSVQFSVGVDGTISLTGATEDTSTIAGTDGTGTYTTSETEGMAVITATDHLAELTITKTDGENVLLPGAEFTATEVLSEGQTGNPHVVSGTTDENGSLVLTGLIAGKQYTLTETKAPAGYELLTDELTFTVNSDGTIDAGWFPPAAFEVDQDAVSVTDDKLLVTMLKQDPNGNPLAGAEFTIEGEFPDGDTSKSFASSDEGIVFDDTQFTGSAEGTRYVVTETSAPEGFELLQGGFEMLVYEDGTVEVLGDSDLAQAVEVTETGGTAVITVNNKPLPGTELTKTGDIFAPLVAGALGLLGLTAIITAAVARRVLRRKE